MVTANGGMNQQRVAVSDYIMFFNLMNLRLGCNLFWSLVHIVSH